MYSHDPAPQDEGVGGALGPVAASLQRPTLKGGFGAACRSR